MKNAYLKNKHFYSSMFLVLSGVFLSLTTSKAATYTVNALTDTGTGAGTTGDLRYCINQANAVAGPHTINFSVAGTINLTATLPVFAQQISVQGNTAPGYALNAPTVQLNGNGNAGWIFLFNVAGGANSLLQGLVMNRATLTNVEINNVNGITVRDCFIGTNMAGNASAGTNPNFGIQLVTASNCFITNNVISGHATHGLLINVNSNTNTVRGNKIGCNLLGTAAIPNAVHGIEINNTSINNIIGGAAAADRNTVSGNTHTGISVVGGSTGTQITNNYIGTTLSGAGALGNGEHGIVMDASANSTITNNVVSGNGFFGLHIINANGHTVRGNKVGINAAGTAAIPNAFVGLRFENSNNAVIGGSAAGEGNTLSGNGEEGIFMINCQTPTIRGNLIGTNTAGTAAVANGRSGLHLQGVTSPIIGGTVAGEGNTCSGNAWDGMQFESTTTATIQGNFIGTNATGMGAIGNGSNGISGYTGSNDHLIGGTAVNARNIISGNNVDGIHYDGITAACNNLQVKNNYIGTNASGAGASATFGNGKSGVVVLNNCLGLVIGGPTAAERNIISGNGRLWGGVGNGTGIVINGGCTAAQIVGNYIGLAVDGTTALGNAENGIVVVYSNNVTIGGNSSTRRNLVSSNGRQGIVLSADPGTPITGSVIIGNYIGTDVSGTLARGNGQSGVISIFGNNGFIGRANANEGNLISNNAEEGIHLVGGSGNTIYNNLIGVALDGTTAMGNQSGGVFIQGVGGGTNGSNNTIGGLGALQANTIAYSTGTGVNPDLGNGFGVGIAHNDQGRQNTIIGNRIFCNAGLGIDLNFTGSFGGAGINSPGNGGKSTPAITAVTGTSTTGTGVNGETIHVYANTTCITCQGQTYLGSAVVAGGTWTVTHVNVPNPANNSATATSAALGTSQFSCNFSLPVELLYFTAQAQGTSALLHWATAMELNNDRFDIQRSFDGVHFETIGSRDGQGSVMQQTLYDFTDDSPSRGLNYYRLKQIDTDGSVSFSPIRKLTFAGTTTWTLYPNPATDELHVTVEGDEQYTFVLYNPLGIELMQLTPERNGNDYRFDLSRLADGAYILDVRGSNTHFTQSFLLY